MIIPEIDARAEIANASTESLVQAFLTDHRHLRPSRVVEKLLVDVRSLSQHQLLLEAEPLPECIVLYPPHACHSESGIHDGFSDHVPFCRARHYLDEVVLPNGVRGTRRTLSPTRGVLSVKWIRILLAVGRYRLQRSWYHCIRMMYPVQRRMVSVGGGGRGGGGGSPWYNDSRFHDKCDVSFWIEDTVLLLLKGLR